MSFDVSALSQYVENNSKQIVTKCITGAQTAQLLIQNKSVQSGLKGASALLKMDSDVNFLDGSTCTRTSLGTTTLTNKTITVVPIKDNQDLCSKTLWNNYFNQFLLAGETPQEQMDSQFAQSIMDYRAKKISTTVESMLWQGDTTIPSSAATANYRFINGILKLHTSGGGSSLAATGSTVVEQLQNVFMNTPIAVRTQDDFRIFIGSDILAKYNLALAAKNLYQPTTDNTLWGTTAKIFAVDGLNGTGKVFASRISNIVLGLDGVSDMDKAEFRYSIETTKYYVDFAFGIGVALYNESEALIGTGF